MMHEKEGREALSKILSYDNVSFWWFIESVVFSALKDKKENKVSFFEKTLIKNADIFFVLIFMLRVTIAKLLFRDKKFKNGMLRVLCIRYSTNWKDYE